MLPSFRLPPSQLKKIQQHGIDELANNPGGCIIAASSLKFAYREIQRGNGSFASPLLAHLPLSPSLARSGFSSTTDLSTLIVVYKSVGAVELPPNALDVLPNGLPASPSRSQVQTLFVYLKGTPEVLAERMAGRKGHYMVRFVSLIRFLSTNSLRCEKRNADPPSLLPPSSDVHPGLGASRLLSSRPVASLVMRNFFADSASSLR